MIDVAARMKALAIIREFESGVLSVNAFERLWPTDTNDLGVKSIGFWVWSLFSDDDIGLVQKETSDDFRKILTNSIEFLSSGEEFVPRDPGTIRKIKSFFSYGVEWIGCELPWHREWPFGHKESDSFVARR